MHNALRVSSDKSADAVAEAFMIKSLVMIQENEIRLSVNASLSKHFGTWSPNDWSEWDGGGITQRPVTAEPR